MLPTLYHWERRRHLRIKGGRQSRDTAEAFAEYAVGQLCERKFVTIS
jgi:hypothetical protein